VSPPGARTRATPTPSWRAIASWPRRWHRRRRGRGAGVPPPAGLPGAWRRQPSHPGRPGPAAERRDEVYPDRETGDEPPGKHYYHEVFNPSVIPYKRMTALDAVTAEETLRVADRRLTLMPVAGGGAGARAGRLLGLGGARPRARALDAAAVGGGGGARALLPARPAGAGGVRARRGGQRLRALAGARAAPPGMAGGRACALLRRGAADQPGLGGVPPQLVHRLPSELQRRAEEVLAKIGVDRGMSYGETLDRLVSYFRGFESGTLPERTSRPTATWRSARRAAAATAPSPSW